VAAAKRTATADTLRRAMTDIGPMLREARMRTGSDISEFEDRTKIRAKYLRALENEEWSLLPGPTFTKGFLRTYGDMLGLDGRLLVDEYKRQWEEPHELDLVPVRPTIGRDTRDMLRSRQRLRRWVAGAALVVVAAVAILLIGDLGSSPTSPGTPPVSTGTTALSGASAGVSASCAPSHGARLAHGCVSLQIRPIVAVYVCLVGDSRVRIDGHRLSSTTTPATYHAHKFVVTLGSGAAVLEIDAHHFDVPRSDGPIGYAISAHGRRRLAHPSTLSCTA